MPLAQLGIDPTLRDSLHKLGVRTVRAFLQLPVAGLRRRGERDPQGEQENCSKKLLHASSLLWEWSDRQMLKIEWNPIPYAGIGKSYVRYRKMSTLLKGNRRRILMIAPEECLP